MSSVPTRLEAAEPLAFEVRTALAPVPGAPTLTDARCALLTDVTVQDEHGARRVLRLPAERPLTLFVDKREIVTLMTLGARPELLVLGWLLNQHLVQGVGDVESVTVDWDVAAAAVKTRHGLRGPHGADVQRMVTSGCGQGTVFGDTMSMIEGLRLPDAASARIDQATLNALLEQVRQRDSVHRRAGSVHGCALFSGSRLLAAAEDVGRHNAVDTLAGWMGQHGVAGHDKLLYTTGRLTSEMVMKAARMALPIVVSRNGVTAMGHTMAVRLGMTLFGRAANRHFLCYSGFERFDADPALAQRRGPMAAG
jgi:FdhD protein